jgi:hypothetical protein
MTLRYHIFACFLSSHDKFLVGYVSGKDSLKTNVFKSKLIDTSLFKHGHYQTLLLYSTIPSQLPLTKPKNLQNLRPMTQFAANGFIRQNSPLLLYLMRAFRRFPSLRLAI